MFKQERVNTRLRQYGDLALLLALTLLFRSTILSALTLFLITSCFLGLSLISSSLLLSLLLILVYLGALIVLFAYIWIYIPYISGQHFSLIIPTLLCPICFQPLDFCSCPLSSYLFATSLLLFLGCLLFWAMVVVVHILDLRLGGFGSQFTSLVLLRFYSA